MEQISALVQQVAGKDVDVDEALMDSGVDSLGAVELRNLLQSAVGEGVQARLAPHEGIRGAEADRVSTVISRQRHRGPRETLTQT